MIQLPKSYVPNEWDSQLDRLPWLMNIARVSLLLSLLTFHVLVNAYGSNVGMARLASMPIFGSRFYIWAAVYGGLIVFSMAFPYWQQQKNNGILFFLLWSVCSLGRSSAKIIFSGVKYAYC